MTDYKVTLKSNIQSVELNKKKVKINCYNNKAGNLVITTLSQNSSIFGGHSYDINKGGTAKDFNVKFDEKDHAEEFKNTIQSILDDTSVVAEEPEKSGIDNLKEKAGNILNRATDVFLGPAPETDAPETDAPAADAPAADNGDNGSGNDDSGKSKTLLIAGGAVLLVLIIGLVIWKTRK